jgi:hypothetical protein
VRHFCNDLGKCFWLLYTLEKGSTFLASTSSFFDLFDFLPTLTSSFFNFLPTIVYTHRGRKILAKSIPMLLFYFYLGIEGLEAKGFSV